ncbi:MAG: hypothetical protein M3348_04675, partial [Acidobacteriota bacterium]|nr:hypothetical protein [Acidobacteriota bacterium]
RDTTRAAAASPDCGANQKRRSLFAPELALCDRLLAKAEQSIVEELAAGHARGVGEDADGDGLARMER